MFDEQTIWMILPGSLQQMLVAAATPSGPREKVLRKAQEKGYADFAPPVSIVNGIATIVIDGVITRRPEWYQLYFDGVSSESITSIIDQLAANPNVFAIVLRIDSPGGEAAGMAEAAAAVRAAAKIKPVIAIADRLMASAAYFLSSGASEIYAAASDARIGSIGTMLVMYDVSQMFAAQGIKPVIIKTGAFKATGTMGAEVTDEQRAYLQGLVDQTQQGFVQAIMDGRSMTADQVQKVADGRVFGAAEAQALGLSNGVKSYDSVIADLSDRAESARSKGAKKTMSATAATITELSILPGVSNDFIVEAQKAGWTIDQASSTWMERQQAALTAAKAETAAAQAAATAAAAAAKATTTTVEKQGATGVDPGKVAEGGANSGSAGNAGGMSAGAQFQAKFKENLKAAQAVAMPDAKPGEVRAEAMRQTIVEDPDGHLAYVQEHNAKHEDTDTQKQKLAGRKSQLA